MIIMGKKKNNGGAIALIMKKLGKSCPESESYKEEMIEEKMEKVPNKDGAESDYKEGMKASADKMIQAFENKNSEELVSALKSFIEMAMHNY